MSSFRSEPMWIHVAGLAVVPIFLELCLLGLAVSDPAAGMVGAIYSRRRWGCAGALDAVSRPFYIFAILAIALKQEQLSSNSEKILSLIPLKPCTGGCSSGVLSWCCGTLSCCHLRQGVPHFHQNGEAWVAKRSIAFFAICSFRFP